MKYATIVADPPWEHPVRGGGRLRGRPRLPYSFMSLDEIKTLPVGELADEQAHLYLWSTRRNFREGIAADVCRAWGFEPCGELIWGLRSPGLGGALGNGHEPILIARRGHLPFNADWPIGVQFWSQPYSSKGKIHSAKPDAFLDEVERLSPGPYLELFARRQRLGWDTWGNEALEHVEMASGL